LAEHNEFFAPETGEIKREGRDFTDGARLGKLRKLRAKDEPLHPQRFTRQMLLKIKRTLQPRHWSALYQQNPVPDEGLYFTKSMFRYVPHLPDYREMYKFVTWDLAVGQRQSNDWTVGVVGALDWNDDIYILDVLRAKWNTHQIAEAIIDAHVKYEALLTGIEKGQLELAIKPTLEKRMQERRQYITLAEGDQALKPVTDKIVRARPLQGRMQQGKVILPSDQPWVEVLQNELLRFPGGIHDDIVDGMAWLIKLVMGHGPPPKPTSVVQFQSWKDKLNEFVEDSRKKHWMAA
jgi:predicted phage terminase large subunit-like protein